MDRIVRYYWNARHLAYTELYSLHFYVVSTVCRCQEPCFPLISSLLATQPLVIAQTFSTAKMGGVECFTREVLATKTTLHPLLDAYVSPPTSGSSQNGLGAAVEGLVTGSLWAPGSRHFRTFNILGNHFAPLYRCLSSSPVIQLTSGAQIVLL